MVLAFIVTAPFRAIKRAITDSPVFSVMLVRA
jgi:hypothetical protein